VDFRRLRAGEWIVGAAGVVLLVSLFLDWYGVEVSGRSAPGGLDAWEAFDVIDVVLLIVALSALALAIVTAFQRTPAIPVAMASIVTILSFAAVILVAYRAIDEPGVRTPVDLSLSGGIWLALGASLAMLAGGARAIRDESPGAPAPPVAAEEIPAPGS
jgi:hypothetical protein